MNEFALVEAPPERVIRLFPKIISGELSIVDEGDKEKDKTGEAGSVHEGAISRDGSTGTPENGKQEEGSVKGTNGRSSTDQLGSGGDGDGSRQGEATTSDDGETQHVKQTVNGTGVDAGPIISSLRRVVGDDASSIRSKKLIDDDSVSIRGSIRGGKQPPASRPPQRHIPSILGKYNPSISI